MFKIRYHKNLYFILLAITLLNISQYENVIGEKYSLQILGMYFS